MNKSVIKTYGFVLATLLLYSCAPKEPPLKEELHYVTGPAYQLGDRWIYPEENFAYKATGLAIISSKAKNTLTADGEIYSPKTMTGAHPTLQLPAIINVRNMDNGRTIRIRINDRPTSSADRILELTPQAAELLGISKGTATKVEIIEDEQQSQSLAFRMPSGPQTQMQVNTAPLNTITVENLDGSKNNQQHTQPLEQTQGNSVNNSVSLPDLPVEYHQGSATGGQLWIDGGSFTSIVYANRLAAKMGGRSIYTYMGKRRVIRVRSGPYSTVQEADQNLDYLLKSGIKGAKIIVE